MIHTPPPLPLSGAPIVCVVAPRGDGRDRAARLVGSPGCGRRPTRTPASRAGRFLELGERASVASARSPCFSIVMFCLTRSRLPSIVHSIENACLLLGTPTGRSRPDCSCPSAAWCSSVRRPFDDGRLILQVGRSRASALSTSACDTGLERGGAAGAHGPAPTTRWSKAPHAED